MRRPKAFYCACGCGRVYRSGAPWDGMHGPDYAMPYVPVPK